MRGREMIVVVVMSHGVDEQPGQGERDAGDGV
jgi:hypothetical protein